MRKSLKILTSCLAVLGLSLSISAKAADYAVILKTLSNPFWVEMKQGIEDEAKKLNVTVDIFASPSEGDYQSQLQLFEDLVNQDYKGILMGNSRAVFNGKILVDKDAQQTKAQQQNKNLLSIYRFARLLTAFISLLRLLFIYTFLHLLC